MRHFYLGRDATSELGLDTRYELAPATEAAVDYCESPNDSSTISVVSIASSKARSSTNGFSGRGLSSGRQIVLLSRLRRSECSSAAKTACGDVKSANGLTASSNG